MEPPRTYPTLIQTSGDGVGPRLRPTPRFKERYWLHVLLFAVTLASTIFAGLMWTGRTEVYAAEVAWFTLMGLPITPSAFVDGFLFGGGLLFFLTVHEFGHYFAARFHHVDTSLPYYLPVPFMGIGTFGAVIRIRQAIPSTRKLFDIGAAGPLAGFVAALGLLLYALATLPDPSYMMDMGGHEAVQAAIRATGTFPETMPPPVVPGQSLIIGQTLLYQFLTLFFDNVPPMYEMYHYPVLFAGWLGLFFTALNLLPVGQLDGGHILYALVGPKWHSRLAHGFFLLLMVSGVVGVVTDPMLEGMRASAGPFLWVGLAAMLYFYLGRVFKGNHRLIAPVLSGILLVGVVARMFPEAAVPFGYWGWLVFCLLIVMLVRVEHPPVVYPQPLTGTRRLLAYVSIIIFLLCFSLKPLYFV